MMFGLSQAPAEYSKRVGAENRKL